MLSLLNTDKQMKTYFVYFKVSILHAYNISWALSVGGLNNMIHYAKLFYLQNKWHSMTAQ